jgi:hypothetical protein
MTRIHLLARSPAFRWPKSPSSGCQDPARTSTWSFGSVHKPGWGINLGGSRWHRIDAAKQPAGQVSRCGVGIIALHHVENNPNWDGTGKLADVLTGKVDAPICRKCAE